MRATWDNKVFSSFYLWLNNKILTKGEAFTNYSSLLYRVRDNYNGYYTYGLPFKQINSDSSIPNATVLSGVYLNGNFVTTGQSGLAQINYEEGHLYFTSALPQNTVISGNYSVKDFNTYITSEAEETIIFETKYDVRRKTTKIPTGLASNVQTLPAIFVKSNGTQNEGFAFGGTDKTSLYLRAIVLANSQFNLDAVCGILRDTNLTHFALFEPEQMPYNPFGGLSNSGFNYNSLVAGKNTVFIEKVEVSRYNSRSVILSEVSTMNPGIFPAIVDFYVCDYREPRQ